MGCLAALLPVSSVGPGTKRWLNLLGPTAAVCMFYSMMTVGFSDRVLYQGGFTAIAFLCAVMVLVAAYYPPTILAVPFRFHPLQWLGRISYGLYLWHWLIVRNTSFYYLGRWEPWARLGLALAVATASFYIVERPFNKLKRYFSASPTKSSEILVEPEIEQSLPPLALPLTN